MNRLRAAATRCRQRQGSPGAPRAAASKLTVLLRLSLLLPAALAACAAPAATGEPPVTEPPVAEPPVSSRPALSDPPDPGPVPFDHGLDETTLAGAVAAMARISGVACGVLHEGSGFAVGPDLVATNAHVLLGLQDPMVELFDGRSISGVPVAYDPVADLAVLRVDRAGLEPLALGSAEDGAIGALLGWKAGSEPEPIPFRIDRPVTVRIEIVGGRDRIERKSWLLAAHVGSGDSGAALVDGDGVVVGIAYATTRRDAGVGYAIRAGELRRLLETADLEAAVQVGDCG